MADERRLGSTYSAISDALRPIGLTWRGHTIYDFSRLAGPQRCRSFRLAELRALSQETRRGTWRNEERIPDRTRVL